LSDCVQPEENQHTKESSGAPFHILLLSRDTSIAHMLSERTLETTGDRLFVSRDGLIWYELRDANPTPSSEAPQSSKHGQLNPLPSQQNHRAT
jgi:hypothetical protein